MGRKTQADYVAAAITVLQELGGGPVSTKTLVAAAQERGLLGDGKWAYHNFSRKVRESDLFDTSVRGQVSLAETVESGPAENEEVETEEGLSAEDFGEEAQQFPNPVLGSGFEE